MKYGLYVGLRTLLRYAFGLFVFSATIHKIDINPFMILLIVIAVLSLMESWSPFKKDSFQNHLSAPDYNAVAVVSIIGGLFYTGSLFASGVGEYGFIIMSQLLRAGIENNLRLLRYVERLSVDFIVIIIGFVLSQSMDSRTAFGITCIALSALSVFRYLKIRHVNQNVLNVKGLGVVDNVES